MKARILVLLLVLFFTASATAEALKELSLKEANFPGFTVEGALQNNCANLIFIKDASAERQGIFVIFSLHANFMPTSSGDANLQLFLNNESTPLVELKPQEFLNNWARIRIPIAGLVEKNSLKICANTSNSITRIDVLEDSKIGYYKMPEFELSKSVSNTRPIIGEELEVTLKAKNTGSEAGKAIVKYWNIELNIAQITKGDAEFEGIIQPGETKTLRYFVKPKYAVQMDLASAVLEFENIFGEKQKIYSDRPTISVQELEFKIKGFFSTEEQKTIQPGKQVNVLLTVRNEGLNDLENVAITIDALKSMQLSKNNFERLSFKAKETKIFAFTASSNEEGSQQISCTAAYTDYALIQTKCQPLTLEFEKPKQNPALMLAVILIIVGALIYIYIYRPEKARTA